MRRLIWIVGAYFLPAAAAAQPFAGLHYDRTEAAAICDQINSIGPMPGATHCEDTDSGWGAFIGYRFNPNASLEASYVDLGRVRAGIKPGDGFAPSELGLAAKATGLGLGLTAHAPLSDNLELIGQLGVLYWQADLEARVTMPGFGIEETWGESSVSPWLGAGALLRLGGGFWARAMFRRYVNVADSDVDAWVVGVEYRL